MDTLKLLPEPGKADFLARATPSRIPPVHIELPLLDPPTVYGSFRGPGSMLFDSARGPHKIARYSFILPSPSTEYRLKEGRETITDLATGKRTEETPAHPFRSLRKLLGAYGQAPEPGLPPFQGGGAGMFSYDFASYIEKLPATTVDDLDIPEAHIFIFNSLIAVDHSLGKSWAIACPSGATPEAYDQAAMRAKHLAESALKASPLNPAYTPASAPPAPSSPLEIKHHMSRQEYEEMVVRAKEYIAAGDIFQANLSLRLSADIGETDPWRLYQRLRAINPSPFAGYLDMGDYQIASSSPERLIRLRDRILDTRPIAGTRPRGKDATGDDYMRSELLLNEKERAEHIMLIDLERNDLGRVCEYGSVEADELMITEDYSHVIHIVSNVRGKLARGKDLFDALRATFPGGTITGVPKVRCMQIIDELERLRRGPYTGSFGYLGYGGSMDLNIIIRTFTVKQGRAYVQAGAGIVADSVPEREYREALKKAEALVRALQSL